MPVTPAPTDNQPAPPAVAEPDVPSSPPVSPPARPDGLPDHFWDEKLGVRTPELVTEFNALAAERAKMTEAFKDFPEKPEDAGKFYTLPEDMLPEGMKAPEGIPIQPDEGLINALLPILHKHRAGRDLYQDAFRAVTGARLREYEAAVKNFEADNKTLGETAPAQRQAVANFLSQFGEAAKHVDTTLITAQNVKMFAAMAAKFANQGNVVPLHRPQDSPPPAPDKPLIDRLADTMYSKKVS